MRAKRQPYYSDEHESWVVPLTRGKVALISAEDVEWISQWNWRWLRTGYAVRNEWPSLKTILLHREIMERLKLLTRAKQWVDHKNGKTLDNRRGNLRICRRAENSQNRRRPKDNTSGIKGLIQDKRRGTWAGELQAFGVRHRRCFGHSSFAAVLWLALERARLHKEFARHE